ncbi:MULTISPECIES: RNA polymerase sigma factor [Butyricimonas]|uniref:RNA polymerase sigma factor n=1 Tax=Butyricimonas TaxID=574697 RepID=UPI000C074E37|nr:MULTISPECIES: sigma-70 family RNA polymerase sigma factor [Butyricimonas]MCB6971484.1 sigma-70 family RNA polymerase sigma factor [Butyricimonas synergistica]MCG4518198.1 sigma-70 family RNA polymerase sigma factor [Butyricimonas sp. DFI.6.44]
MENGIKSIDTFKELYMSHFQAVVGFCHTYLKDREQSMDVTQETFFKLYERLDDAYSRQNAIAFLYITAKNLCMDVLRHEKFNTEDVDELKEKLYSDDFFLDEITNQEMIRFVQAAVAQLTGRSLEIARLALDGLGNQEIADTLGISINSVKSLKKEMYSKLREIIGKEYVILFFAKYLLKI